MTRTLRLLPLCLAAALAATPAPGHSSKTGTSPPDGATLDAAPDSLAMTFDAPMRITLFRVTDEAGTEVPVERSDGMAPVLQFEAVPGALAPGAYRVEWRGMAEDGHVMKGGFSFSIQD